jgi:glycosyltransferase involved in cell wall biosynthesis
MNISICAPTRQRPDHIERLIQSAVDTASTPNLLEFCFYCDDDDALTQEKLTVLSREYHNIKFISGPRTIFSDTWNHCYQLSTADVIMMGSDDIVFRTKNWDQAVLDEFDQCPDKILFVYGDDLKQGIHLGTHGFLHRKWIQVCGYFSPPYFSADYCDTWINDVANQLGRKLFLPDVVIEHMHVSMKKAAMDDNARDRVVRSRRDDNRGIFYSAEKMQERNRQVQDLKNLMDSSYQIDTI